MLLPTAHPDLQAAYPPHTLACILACIVLTEQRLGSAAPVFWEVSGSLGRLSGRALMTEDELPSSLVPNVHHGWIRPTISCDLPPPQSLETSMPASLRQLVLHESILMSRHSYDDQMAGRDTEDAGLAPSRSNTSIGGERSLSIRTATA